MPRTPKAPVNPVLLSWAREIAGYPSADAARRASVTEDRLSAWETGEDQPTLAQLRKLAHLYRRPPALFFLDQPPPRDLPEAPDFRGGAERDRLSPMLRQQMRFAVQRRAALIELQGERDRGLADVEIDTADVYSAAQTVRSAIGIPVFDQLNSKDANRMLDQWIGAVESSGFVVFQMSRIPLSEARGFSIYDTVAPVIVLNGADPPQARSFTLFHELCHLLERSGGICGWTDDNAERRCNAFAAEVLMPRQDFIEELGAGDAREMVGTLAERFRVSREAAAIRLRVLGRLSQGDVDQVRQESAEYVARTREIQRGREGGPAFHRIHLRNLGRRYVEAILDAQAENRINAADAAHYLEAKVSTIERMEDLLRGTPKV